MTPTQSLLAFVVAAAVLALTPGADTAMVLRTSAVRGAKHGAFAAAGVALGCLVWGAAVALGLGAVVATSAVAFGALKWAGAGYLVWLGVRLLVTSREIGSETEGAREAGRDRPADALRRGLFTNLLNPKVSVFYVSFLPQFVPPDVAAPAYMLLLVAIHVALGVAWLLVVIAMSATLGRVLRRPSFARSMDRITGCVFIGFGARLALSFHAR